MQPWRVKICGVTCAEDALAVVAAGADAIGLNFFPQSRRYVEPGLAASMVADLPAGLWKVGVFVNATAAQIHGICQFLALDLVQLHGDEPPELLAELGNRPVVRAFRCGPAGLADRGRLPGTMPEIGRLAPIRLAGRTAPGTIWRYRSHLRLGIATIGNSSFGWHAVGARRRLDT